MNCDDAANLIHAYLDGELDPAQSAAIEEHLRGCPACAALHERQQALRATLQGAALSYTAPPGLQGRIRAAARRADGAAPGRRARAWVRLGVAAGLLLAVGGAALFLSTRPRVPAEDRVSREVVSRYVFGVMPEHPPDVKSTDTHEVKPWFAPRLDFAPPVVDLKDDGYPLVGGRLEYVNDRKVAALIYQRHKHVINLLIWPMPGAPDAAPAALTHQGYHLVHWTQAGMTFWAVSDLNAAELQQFAELIRNHAE